MRSSLMDDPSRQDVFAERSLSMLGSFEYQVLQLRTMSDPLDATFVSRALAAIQSIRMEAADLELDAIESTSRDIQTAIQQIAALGNSPNPTTVRKILRQTDRLRQLIETEANEPTGLDDRQTTQNAGSTKTPAPKRVRPPFTPPPAANRLEDLMDEIQIRLDDCLSVEGQTSDTPEPTEDSDLPSADGDESENSGDDVIES
ncbi:hypothetical protein [Rhodopirellula bahusiensis]|uniref:Uncharacterized protein n=1 Tax=Rhodopirellula bahusiensis TaxID=2014065 RepID=A0A2G1W4B0_9BACT|nr:hypothetical protein [Rhodopirellula bahusiensis]PHQ33509.1 hypothetical protein CEE69_19605 [Rhodopirellula bahusiensis]